MSKILNNLPVEDLNEANDYLGIIDKGQIIKTFLESNTGEFKDIKMFSLYGEWGSGKSTLMKYLQKELKGNFNTFFFEAWEFESDSNLALSLLEFLELKSQDTTEAACGEIIKVASKLFRGFSKSIRVNFPGLSIDGTKIIETLEEEPEDSFLQLKHKFKTEFRRWESEVAKGGSPKYNIVFIDDLDRCEPENVLSLLSALKLFFTYGEKTIFFCGVDKKAVNEAVKTKYKEVVKANEYLEKIFDISFTMPKHDDLLKLVSQYFDEKLDKVMGKRVDEMLAGFFNELKFTNPRRVKKVLNKFQILRSIKARGYSKQIPNVYLNNSGNYFETIVIIYLIILHEFESINYNNIFDLKSKEVKYLRVVKDVSNYSVFEECFKELIKDDIINKPLRLLSLSNNQMEDLIFVFAPQNIENFTTSSFKKNNYLDFTLESESTESRFLNYLINTPNILSNSNKFSEISFVEMKEIVRLLL